MHTSARGMCWRRSTPPTRFSSSREPIRFSTTARTRSGWNARTTSSRIGIDELKRLLIDDAEELTAGLENACRQQSTATEIRGSSAVPAHRRSSPPRCRCCHLPGPGPMTQSTWIPIGLLADLTPGEGQDLVVERPADRGLPADRRNRPGHRRRLPASRRTVGGWADRPRRGRLPAASIRVLPDRPEPAPTTSARSRPTPPATTMA